MEEELEIVQSVCGAETCHFSMSGFCPVGTCVLPLPVHQSLDWLAKSASAKALAKQIGPAPEDFFYVHDCTVEMSPDERGWAGYYQECWFPFTDDDYVESLEQAVNKLRAAVADSIQNLPVTEGSKEGLRGLTTFHFFLLRFEEGVEDARICVNANAEDAEDLEEGALKASFRLHLAVGLAFWATRCLAGGKDVCFSCCSVQGTHVPLMCLTHAKFYCCFKPDHNNIMAFHISLEDNLFSFTLTQDHLIADFHIHQ